MNDQNVMTTVMKVIDHLDRVTVAHPDQDRAAETQIILDRVQVAVVDQVTEMLEIYPQEDRLSIPFLK